MREEKQINFENAPHEEIEVAMKCGLTRRAYTEMQGIELMDRGYKRAEVEKILSVSTRTMQRWIREFNTLGIDGVIERGDAGRPRKIYQPPISGDFGTRLFAVGIEERACAALNSLTSSSATISSTCTLTKYQN